MRLTNLTAPTLYRNSLYRRSPASENRSPPLKFIPPVRLQSNDQSACHLWQCRQGIGLATHFQMSKMRMRKQTQKRVSAGFVNVEVGLDAPWSVQPHRWKKCPLPKAELLLLHPQQTLSASTPYLKFLCKFSRIFFRVYKFRNGGVAGYVEYSGLVQSGK